MHVVWTAPAERDLQRVYNFLANKNHLAAAKVVDALSEAPNRLLIQPRVGQRIETITSREVRRIVVGQYEIRYAVVGEVTRVVRIFHTREER
jgi:plasmid stabilization system protein ParE